MGVGRGDRTNLDWGRHCFEKMQGGELSDYVIYKDENVK